jgi:hypothetical protein
VTPASSLPEVKDSVEVAEDKMQLSDLSQSEDDKTAEEIDHLDTSHQLILQQVSSSFVLLPAKVKQVALQTWKSKVIQDLTQVPLDPVDLAVHYSDLCGFLSYSIVERVLLQLNRAPHVPTLHAMEQNLKMMRNFVPVNEDQLTLEEIQNHPYYLQLNSFLIMCQHAHVFAVQALESFEVQEDSSGEVQAEKSLETTTKNCPIEKKSRDDEKKVVQISMTGIENSAKLKGTTPIKGDASPVISKQTEQQGEAIDLRAPLIPDSTTLAWKCWVDETLGSIHSLLSAYGIVYSTDDSDSGTTSSAANEVHFKSPWKKLVLRLSQLFLQLKSRHLDWQWYLPPLGTKFNPALMEIRSIISSDDLRTSDDQLYVAVPLGPMILGKHPVIGTLYQRLAEIAPLSPFILKQEDGVNIWMGDSLGRINAELIASCQVEAVISYPSLSTLSIGDPIGTPSPAMSSVTLGEPGEMIERDEA